MHALLFCLNSRLGAEITLIAAVAEAASKKSELPPGAGTSKRYSLPATLVLILALVRKDAARQVVRIQLLGGVLVAPSTE